MATLPHWVITIIGAVFPGFGEPLTTEYNGYVEGEYVYVAPTAVGRIITITTKEGDR